MKEEVYDRFLGQTDEERAKIRKKAVRSIPASFGDALTYFMKHEFNGKADDMKLGISSGLGKRMITAYRTNPQMVYKPDELVRICVGLHLQPWQSDELFKRANIDVERIGPRAYLGFIIDCLYLESITTIQAFLETNGLRDYDFL